MLRLFLVVSLWVGMGLSATHHGTYRTISQELKALFTNNLDDEEQWTNNMLWSDGTPGYTVGCSENGELPWASTSYLSIASEQTIGESRYCLPEGPIGIALNGVAIFSAASATNEDAFTAEGNTFDGCGGHTDQKENYRYHIIPGSIHPQVQGKEECFPQIPVPKYPENTLGTAFIIGVALDGFPIFATISNGTVVQETDLDECGGKAYDEHHYAYFISPVFPYTIGCYKGIIGDTGPPVQSVSRCPDSSTVEPGGLCYCNGQGLNDVPCLPASGETTCNGWFDAQKAANTQLSGTCIEWTPGKHDVTDAQETQQGTNQGRNQPNLEGGQQPNRWEGQQQSNVGEDQQQPNRWEDQQQPNRWDDQQQQNRWEDQQQQNFGASQQQPNRGEYQQQPYHEEGQPQPNAPSKDRPRAKRIRV